MLIFWDIDGTLMYCGSDGTKALNQTFAKLYNIEDAFHKVGIGSAMDSMILEKIMDKFNISDDHLSDIKTTFLTELEAILEADADKRVLPGIRELIYYAEREGHVNSLLTSNMKVGAEAKLRSVNLDGYFVGGGFGDDKGEKWDIAKRAKKEIEELQKQHFRPEDVVVIGDSIYDINTARKLGYNIISVATGWTPRTDLEKAVPDVLFEHLGDVDAVMDVLSRMTKGA